MSAPNLFWEWRIRCMVFLGVPMLVYLLERFLRIYRQKSWRTRVLSTKPLPGNVTAIIFSKPKRFKYKSGMYVFIKCPSISRFEWHPYTLTSAPQDNFLSVHIAQLGDWSSAINAKFSSSASSEAMTCTPNKIPFTSVPVEASVASDSFSASRETSEVTLGSLNELLELKEDSRAETKLFVDGPYGAPAQDHEEHKVLLLVGAGIGVTPFASILRNLLNQFEDHRCMHCGKVWYFSKY